MASLVSMTTATRGSVMSAVTRTAFPETTSTSPTPTSGTGLEALAPDPTGAPLRDIPLIVEDLLGQADDARRWLARRWDGDQPPPHGAGGHR